jgi:voltage-gated potassium channel
MEITMSTDNLNQSQELKNTSYELFMLLLSVLSIFNLLVFIIPRIDPVVVGVVAVVDGFITVIFILDFLYRFFTAESKSDYFFRNWGWADLLASMPVQQFKIFRVFRIVRVIRLLRMYGWSNMMREIRENRAGSALFLTIFIVIIVLEFGGMGIVFAEAYDTDSNIKTAGDGVWWAFVTITTVGYGDQFPVTNLGRFMGFFVMILGVGSFAVLTGFLANAFLSAGDEDPLEQSGPTDQYEEMSEFRRLLHEQEKMNIVLLRKLEQIEAAVTSQSSKS